MCAIDDFLDDHTCPVPVTVGLNLLPKGAKLPVSSGLFGYGIGNPLLRWMKENEVKASLVGVLSAAYFVACLSLLAAAAVAIGWFENMKYIWYFASIGGLACGISAGRRYIRDGGFNWRSQLLGYWAVRLHEARKSKGT